MRIRGRPPSHLVMQRGTYESSCSAAEAAGATTTPATRAICYFALSATRSLIKRPPRRSSSAFFKSRCNIRHAATGGRAVLHSFFPPSPLLTLLLPRDPLSPCVPLTNASRRPGESESDGISSKPLHELPGDSLLWEKFVLLRRETQIPFYKGTFFNIGSVPGSSGVTHCVDI